METIKKQAQVCGVSAYISKGQIYVQSIGEGDDTNFSLSVDTGLISLSEFEEEIKNQSSNDTVSKVRAVCDARAQQGGYGRFTTQADPRYINCINEEWAKYPAAKATNLQFEAPSTEPYYHTFVSPIWSADYAGWSLLVTIFIAMIIVMRLVVLGMLKLMLRRRNKLF